MLWRGLELVCCAVSSEHGTGACDADTATSTLRFLKEKIYRLVTGLGCQPANTSAGDVLRRDDDPELHNLHPEDVVSAITLSKNLR